MGKTILIKMAATVAVIFSLLTIVEGSQILFGITQLDYVVFTPLLIYNVAMAVAGLFIGVLIWLNHKKALMLTSIVTVLHLIVLIVVGVIHVSFDAVAMHSVQAMTIRTVIWLAITIVAWRINQSIEISSKKITANK